MRNYLRLWINLLGLFISTSALGTHIVGGDFYYRQLGNNWYQITMKLYIDCENGNIDAIASDAIAIIGVFDAGTNQLVDQFDMTRTGPVRLNKVQYKCVIPEQDVCVDQYTYVKNITLDPGANGKILSFQRCCRNNTINNLVEPESTGSTYWVKIPGRNVISQDNSPVFKELPPNYICTNAPLVFDHSATDSDGDSLVYELYQPFLGANRDKPRPDNTFQQGYFDNPPFTNVIWKFPYATDNQMGGNPILEIDSKTGLLTVTPTTEGQFVMGIKVLEYRKGVLIGETLRDYQFNVRACKFDVVSAFVAPVYSCSDTVYFDNRSYKATKYRWDFGDPTKQDDTSNLATPFYVFPGNGNYTVTLRASNSLCEDVYSTTVRVKSKIVLDLGPNDTACYGFDKYLNTKIFDATKTIWNTGARTTYLRVQQPGIYGVTVYYGNCTATDSVRFSLDPVIAYVSSDTIYCDSVFGTISVEYGNKPEYRFRWNNNPQDTMPYLNVRDIGINTVEIFNKWCSIRDTIELWTATPPEIGPYLFVCNEFERLLDAFEKNLDGGNGREATYLWDNGNTDRFNLVNSSGWHWVEVRQRNCVFRDSLFIDNPIIPLELGPNRHFCDQVDITLEAPPGMRHYTWSNECNTQTNRIRTPGTYYLTVTDTNGCIKSDSIQLDLTLSPGIHIGNDTTICVRSQVKAGLDKAFSAYSWSHGPISAYTYLEDAGIYILTVTDEFGCKGTDSIRITVDPNALPNELFFPNAFSPNGDGLNEVFPYKDWIPQPEYSVKIFNRWGEKLFDSKESGNQRWDGMYKDGTLRPEVYVYLVEYRGCDGDFRRKGGTVTLLK